MKECNKNESQWKRSLPHLSADAPDSDRKDLLSELEVMKTLKPHPNVIKLLGCVTESGRLLSFDTNLYVASKGSIQSF